jgi:hypothetical protein
MNLIAYYLFFGLQQTRNEDEHEDDDEGVNLIGTLNPEP